MILSQYAPALYIFLAREREVHLHQTRETDEFFVERFPPHQTPDIFNFDPRGQSLADAIFSRT